MTAEPPPPHIPDLTVAIATIGARLGHIRLPAAAPGVRYEIFVQRPANVLPQTARADVAYIPLASIGLSHSRNSAVAQCTTPLLVFADDDMELDTNGLTALAAQMEAAPHLGFAAGWRAARMPSTGRRARRYRLRKYNTGRICAPELMVRVDAVRAAAVTFDTQFGLGAQHPVGEDYIFVCDMLDAGLHGAAFPIVTGLHSEASTGDEWDDPQLLSARRTVLTRCFGPAAPWMRLAYALRHRKRLGGLAGAWRFWAGRINSGQNS